MKNDTFDVRQRFSNMCWETECSYLSQSSQQLSGRYRWSWLGWRQKVSIQGQPECHERLSFTHTLCVPHHTHHTSITGILHIPPTGHTARPQHITTHTSHTYDTPPHPSHIRITHITHITDALKEWFHSDLADVQIENRRALVWLVQNINTILLSLYTPPPNCPGSKAIMRLISNQCRVLGTNVEF